MNSTITQKLPYSIVSKHHPFRSWLPLLCDYCRFHIKGHAKSKSIFTHMTLQERVTLYRLARSLAPGATIVEIGSYLGASSCFLAAGASEIPGEKGKVYCIDTWENLGACRRNHYMKLFENHSLSDYYFCFTESGYSSRRIMG